MTNNAASQEGATAKARELLAALPEWSAESVSQQPAGEEKEIDYLRRQMKAVWDYLSPNESNDMEWCDEVICAIGQIEQDAAQPAVPEGAWKSAVLDALANTCMDAPKSEPPASILARIIKWHVDVSHDPRVSAAMLATRPDVAP